MWANNETRSGDGAPALAYLCVQQYLIYPAT